MKVKVEGQEGTQPTVVFDLDGTLVHGDSFGYFCLYLAKLSPLRALVILLLSPLLGLGALHSRGRAWAAASAIWLLTTRQTAADLLIQKRAFVRSRFPSESELIIHEAVDALVTLAREGAEIFIVTGCEEELAHLVVERLLLPPDVLPRILGSRLVRRRNGFVPSFHCYGARKLAALREAGRSPPFACVYTDSSADLPLLRAAIHGYLVRPSPRHRVRVSAELTEIRLL